MSKPKIEITKIAKADNELVSYPLDGEYFFKVHYKVIVHGCLSMNEFTYVWAKDDLDAYQKSKHRLSLEKPNNVRNGVSRCYTDCK